VPDVEQSGDAERLEVDTGPFAGTPGTFNNPVVISALPFFYSGDTSAAPSDVADSYVPCAPSTNESGGEFVFRLDLAEPAWLTVSVDDVPGDLVDADVHLLTAPDTETCVIRDNVSFSYLASPPSVWIVVDTWVNKDGLELSGAFQLSVTETDSAPAPASCTQSPIQCQESDTLAPFSLSSEPAGAGGCPDGMVGIEEFCIDRYEAALLDDSTDADVAWPPYLYPDDTLVRAVSVPGAVPQGYISQIQASQACIRSGKRLCTNDEWLRACRGPAQTVYPYGNTKQPGSCNDARPCHPVVQYFESTADWIWSELGHPCINQLPDSVALTGAHPDCVSVEGVFDLMGNLHEWTADPSGTFRGGFYVDTEINGPGCLYATTAHGVSHWDYSTGFRCCSDL
jgi:hypothetical protein